jgi:hypothetical protein
VTLREAADKALFVQDACNLSAVVHEWCRILPIVWEDVRKARPDGTYPYGADVNEHPICVLFASKVASLARCESPSNFCRAYDAVRELAAEVSA